jgi:hypothetical protein
MMSELQQNVEQGMGLQFMVHLLAGELNAFG